MKVFISWSGEKSREVAEAVRWWLSVVHQGVDTWVSTKDIHVGDRWATEIESGLADATYGIICVTPENVDSKWINYEAGAISKKIGTTSGKVAVLLIDFASETDLEMPLSQFHAVMMTQPGFEDLAKSINLANENGTRSESAVLDAAELAWPVLEKKLSNIKVTEPNSSKRKRTDKQLLEEVLLRIRKMDERIEGLAAEQRLHLWTQESSPRSGGGRSVSLQAPRRWSPKIKRAIPELISPMLAQAGVEDWNLSFGEDFVTLILDRRIPPTVRDAVHRAVERFAPMPFEFDVTVDPEALARTADKLATWESMRAEGAILSDFDGSEPV